MNQLLIIGLAASLLASGCKPKTPEPTVNWWVSMQVVRGAHTNQCNEYNNGITSTMGMMVQNLRAETLEEDMLRIYRERYPLNDAQAVVVLSVSRLP